MAAKPEIKQSKNGAPTKFKAAFCDLLIEHMTKGFSYESFAGHPDVQVHRDTLYEWEKVHPEFSDAKKRAVDANLLFWENLGIENIISETSYERGGGESISSSSRSLNSSVWIFNMKNRHKWRDKQPDENDQININVTLAEKMAKARARAGKK